MLLAGTSRKLHVTLLGQKKVFGSYYILKNIGRVGRHFFLLFIFFNLHDSLELDGFDKGLPCFYMH